MNRAGDGRAESPYLVPEVEPVLELELAPPEDGVLFVLSDELVDGDEADGEDVDGDDADGGVDGVVDGEADGVRSVGRSPTRSLRCPHAAAIVITSASEHMPASTFFIAIPPQVIVPPSKRQVMCQRPIGPDGVRCGPARPTTHEGSDR